MTIILREEECHRNGYEHAGLKESVKEILTRVQAYSDDSKHSSINRVHETW